MTRRGSTCFNK